MLHPAADDLFKIDDASEKLGKAAAEKPHERRPTIVFGNRVRPDILPITFCQLLSQRVRTWESYTCAQVFEWISWLTVNMVVIWR